MHTIWTQGTYQFLFTALPTSNSIAYSYLRSNYNVRYTPTCYFDGGYDVWVGGDTDTSVYTSRIWQSGVRSTHDIYLSVSLTLIDSLQLQISFEVSSRELTAPRPDRAQLPEGCSFVTPDSICSYWTSCVDSAGRPVYYEWDFGNGDTSSWLGPYGSGDTCMISHFWASQGVYQVAVLSRNDWTEASQWSDSLEVTVHDFLCGDANADGFVNISDAVYLIQYIFSGGPAPNPLAEGDANCDVDVNISDAVYLIGYIFSGGPAPCEACK